MPLSPFLRARVCAVSAGSARDCIVPSGPVLIWRPVHRWRCRVCPFPCPEMPALRQRSQGQRQGGHSGCGRVVAGTWVGYEGGHRGAVVKRVFFLLLSSGLELFLKFEVCENDPLAPFFMMRIGHRCFHQRVMVLQAASLAAVEDTSTLLPPFSSRATAPPKGLMQCICTQKRDREVSLQNERMPRMRA